MSVVPLLGEIKLYLQINLKNIENIGLEKVILQLSSIHDEQGNVRRLLKRRIYGNDSKYSKNSRSGNLETLTTLTIKAVANLSKASRRESDIFI
jgi:hypothetical protein